MKKTYQIILKIRNIILYSLAVGVSVGVLIFLFNSNDLLDNVVKIVLEILTGSIILSLLILLRDFLQKEKREQFNQELELKTNDWIEFSWVPFKKNVNRKEFWELLLWPIGKICNFVTRLIFDLILYLFAVFVLGYYLLSDPNKIAVSDIITVITALSAFIFLSIFANIAVKIIKKKLTMGIFLKNLFDLLVISVILWNLKIQIAQSGSTTNGVKNFLMTIDHFVNGHMYLLALGIILGSNGYVFTKLIERSIEEEMVVDLIPTLFGYEYYVDYGKYDGLIHTNIVHTSIQEFTLKGMKRSLREGQQIKKIDRKKEVYNFFEVEASLRYGVGKLRLDGNNIQQNKPHFYWEKGVLEHHTRK